MFAKLFSRFKGVFSSHMARGATGSFGLQVIEAGVGFLTSIVLARVLGVAEFGAYAFGIALAGFLTIPALLGFNTLAIKEVAAAKAKQEWSEIRSFVKVSLFWVTLASTIIVATAFFLLNLFEDRLDPSIQAAALAALLILPVLALLKLYEGFIRGLGRVVIAQFPSRMLRPIVFLILVLSSAFLARGIEVGVYAVFLNLFATAIALAILWFLWRSTKPRELASAPPLSTTSTGFRQALPFALIASVVVINTQSDILMLGILGTPEETGIYRVSSRIASLASFALMAVLAITSPRIASLYALGEQSKIQQLCSKAALASTAIALPMVLIMIFAGHWVLFLFGQDFLAGDTVLKILSLGQFINAAMGIAGGLLVMTGHQSATAKILTTTAFLNIILNYILIPSFGALGAAAATATSYLVWNAALAVAAWRALGIDPTVFSNLDKLRY